MVNARCRFVLGAISSLCLIGFAFSHTPRTKGALTPPQERKLVNKIPPHIPISIKIKKEKENAFKDLANENWAHDFELEVTNTGSKPIYALDLIAFFDVPNADSDHLSAWLVYGRPEVGDLRSVPTPDDVPIKAGESVVLAVHPGTLKAWEINGRKEGWRLPTSVELVFQFLSFGDHTGYVGTQGGAMPWHPERPTINFNFADPKSDQSRPAALEWRSFSARLSQFQSSAMPAKFLPVNFFNIESAHTLTVEAEPSNWSITYIPTASSVRTAKPLILADIRSWIYVSMVVRAPAL